MGNYQAFESFSCFQKNSRILRWRLTIFEGHAIHSSHGKKKLGYFLFESWLLNRHPCSAPMKIYDTQYTFIWKGGGNMKKLQGAFYPLEPPRNKKSQLVGVKKTHLGISHLLKNDEPHSPSQIRPSERNSYLDVPGN